MLIELLKQFNIDFCAVAGDNITDIVFMMPYLPFKEYPKNCVQIDSFYITSNTLYNKVKDIEKVAGDNGYQIVKRDLHLKKIAQVGGLGSVLDNMLLVNNKYGSKTTLQGFSVIGEYTYTANDMVNKICDNCHKCDIACPVMALSKGKFTREKCLRHKQDFASNYYEEVGRRVLGCEECQNVCPYNSHIEQCEMSKEIANVFDYNNIFNMIIGGRKGLQPLSNLIGSNMARPTFIFNLTINSLLASKNYNYTDIIRTFTAHKNDKIKDKAIFYMQSINN